MNLIPPWLTNDLDNVTTKPVELTIASYSFVSFQLGRLFSGIATSDCPLPCTTISTEAKLTDKYEHVNPGFGLQFQQTVEVTSTKMMTPTLSSFLSEVGGSLGLWLGLGVLQVLQEMSKVALPIMRKFGGFENTQKRP